MRLLILILLLGLTPPATAARCLGKDPCRACKNCRYCKWCNDLGGTCGICTPRASRVSISERPVSRPAAVSLSSRSHPYLSQLRRLVQEYDNSRVLFNHELALARQGECPNGDSQYVAELAYTQRREIFRKLVKLSPPRQYRSLHTSFETVLRWSISAVAHFVDTGDRKWLSQNSTQISAQLTEIKRQVGLQ